LLGQLGKQTLFLRAGHHHGLVAFDGALKVAGLAAAQCGVEFEVFTQRLVGQLAPGKVILFGFPQDLHLRQPEGNASV
jgi:hypothetical protein